MIPKRRGDALAVLVICSWINWCLGVSGYLLSDSSFGIQVGVQLSLFPLFVVVLILVKVNTRRE